MGAQGEHIRQLCIEQGVPASFIDSFINPTVSVATVSSGNTDLQPEIGKTKTVGAVWEPAFDSALFQEFSLSVDFWEIKIEEVINTLGACPGSKRSETAGLIREGGSPRLSV